MTGSGGAAPTDRGAALDLIDRKIVAELQRDATLSIAQIADRVGLSQTPCWKRIQKLAQTGVITGRVALAAPEKLGLGLTAFVEIEALDHSAAWRDTFAAVVAAMPEVMELHRMADDVDYLMRVAVADMAAFDAFYKRLTDAVALKNVTSRFAMERIKSTTVYPLDTTNR
jgi:Lrp/AsnC family transcriptional regulator